ncbi:MAG: NADH-quinone oxidoreductase subunit C [Anaerolineae bacterium]
MAEENLTVEKLRKALPDAVGEVATFRGETTIMVKKERIVDVALFLRDDEELGYNFLSTICGVDYLGREPRFAVVYHLCSMTNKRRVRLKVLVDEDDPVVPTLTTLWPGANWYEREVYDMFGISFDGHPDLRRILMPDDWEGHPLRKDYPLGREEVAFTFNQEEIARKKPFATE